jgi:hypothetical protein
MDDFLKQGGINLEDEQVQKQESSLTNEEAKVPQTPVYSTDADDRMSGWLNKSSIKIPGMSDGDANEDILGNIVSGIGSGLKLGLKTFTETI